MEVPNISSQPPLKKLRYSGGPSTELEPGEVKEVQASTEEEEANEIISISSTSETAHNASIESKKVSVSSVKSMSMSIDSTLVDATEDLDTVMIKEETHKAENCPSKQITLGGCPVPTSGANESVPIIEGAPSAMGPPGEHKSALSDNPELSLEASVSIPDTSGSVSDGADRDADTIVVKTLNPDGTYNTSMTGGEARSR